MAISKKISAGIDNEVSEVIKRILAELTLSPSGIFLVPDVTTAILSIVGASLKWKEFLLRVISCFMAHDMNADMKYEILLVRHDKKRGLYKALFRLPPKRRTRKKKKT
jgi:hypothetical protein